MSRRCRAIIGLLRLRRFRVYLSLGSLHHYDLEVILMSLLSLKPLAVYVAYLIISGFHLHQAAWSFCLYLGTRGSGYREKPIFLIPAIAKSLAGHVII